jgi:alanyl-tRNA synthetase
MRTERLYYNDSMLFSFDARVVRAEENRVVLDRTAFYPTSGGQPYDTGTLGGARVLNVEDNDDGEVVHFLDRPLPEGDVHGEIDSVRRFDHIQQHTGQHLLSAVFMELFQFPTVSFHLGAESCTIDLSISKMTDEQVVRAEERSNALIVENRAVQVSYRTKEEVAALGLRKETKREGEIRLIEIAGLDLCACGGTHVRATGEIGAILLRKVEKVKQGIRVEFVCGHRAVRWARRDFTALAQASTLYSTAPYDLPALIAKKLEEAKVADRERKHMQEALGAFEAKEMYAQATPDAAGIRVMERIFDTGDPNYLRQMAGQIARQPAARAIFALRQPPTLFVAQTAGLPGAPDLGAMVKQLGLRGGGSKDAAQGGAASWDVIEQAIAGIRGLATDEHR